MQIELTLSYDDLRLRDVLWVNYVHVQGFICLSPNYDNLRDSSMPPHRLKVNSQCTYENGVAVCTGSGAGKLGLVVAAVDSAGLADMMAIATPTVPPMTRVPFFNTYGMDRACLARIII